MVDEHYREVGGKASRHTTWYNTQNFKMCFFLLFFRLNMLVSCINALGPDVEPRWMPAQPLRDTSEDGTSGKNTPPQTTDTFLVTGTSLGQSGVD